MNKKFIFSIVPGIALALCSIAFSSCGDDEEENSGGSNPGGPSVTFSDKLLTQAGQYIFHYDEKKRCNVVETYDYYDGPFKEVEIDYSDNSVYFDSEGMGMKVAFNQKGYITKLSGSWNENEEGEVSSGSLSISFTYDKSNHITSTTLTSDEKEIYEGIEFKYSGTGKSTYTWSNDNLVNITTKYVDYENGEKSETIDKYDITYNEGMENKTRQIPVVLSYYLIDYDISSVAIVGLFGVGPKNLPEIIINEYTEDGESYEPYETNVSYELNSDGTIKSENIDGEIQDYAYTAINDVRSKMASSSAKHYAGPKARKAGTKLFRMLKHLQKRNNVVLQK